MRKIASQPWSTLIAAAHRLGLSPSEFWSLSLVEWQALTGANVQTVMTRQDLATLMKTYPDQTHET